MTSLPTPVSLVTSDHQDFARQLFPKTQLDTLVDVAANFKRCGKREGKGCHQYKHIDEFNKGNASHGRRGFCRDCQHAMHDAYRKKPWSIKRAKWRKRITHLLRTNKNATDAKKQANLAEIKLIKAALLEMMVNKNTPKKRSLDDNALQVENAKKRLKKAEETVENANALLKKAQESLSKLTCL
jgi:predicted Zn-dependent protease